MNQIEQVKTHLDNSHRELQRLQIENARSREANLNAGVEQTYCGEVGRLTGEVYHLRMLLHEAKENEPKPTEEAQAKEILAQYRHSQAMDVV